MGILATNGCLHIEGHKDLTKDLDVVVVNDPSVIGKIYIPLTSSAGKPMTLLVKDGDEVKVNTKLGVLPGFDVPVYSSVSGKVLGQETRFCASVGRPVPHLVIENDFKNEKVLLKTVDVENASKEELVAAIKEAGIVGLGGAGFPTYVKYQVDNELLLINGIECEPYLTTDYKAIPEKIDLLVKGVKILMKAANAKKAVIAIKVGRPANKEALDAGFAGVEGVEIKEVANVYPAGWERVLIRQVFKKEYEKLPSEIGIVVNNVQTVMAVADALLNGNAITQKLITISGNAIKTVGNFVVPVGTVAGSLIEFLGGYTEENVVILAGGPMTSKGQMNDKFIIDRNNGGLIVLKHVEYKAEACLRCGACTQHCPMGLQPVEIKRAVEDKNVDRMIELQADKCVECGLCSFVCPSKIDVTESIKKAKLQLRIAAMKKK